MSWATINSPDGLKAIREALCVAQTVMGHFRAGEHDLERRGVIARLIEDIDRQRPLGPDGKHGDRHTATCGCGEHTFPWLLRAMDRDQRRAEEEGHGQGVWGWDYRERVENALGLAPGTLDTGEAGHG